MSFWRTFYHLVWTTKNREHLITPKIEGHLYAYIVSRADELQVSVYTINGWYDHVHLLVCIPPKHAVAQVVKHLKGASSHFLNHEFDLSSRFAWQRGYGVLTLGERQRPQAEAYIRNQKQHHQEQTAIAWLEYTADVDEGPQQSGTGSNQVIREEQTTYAVFGDVPW